MIDQAKGIVVERYELTADQAFDLLARSSMLSNRKLRDVADELVRAGDLPAETSTGRSPRRPRT